MEHGTWKGILESDYATQNLSGVQKNIFFSVRQRFLSIHFTTFTDSFVGTSYLESFLLKEERGVRKIIYLYGKDRSDLGKQKRNEGVCELKIIISQDENLYLEGYYWTNIKTKGAIKLEKISDGLIESYEDGLKLKIKK